MKRRRVEVQERRRPLVEINLLGQAKGRAAAASRGCLSLLGRSMFVVVGIAIVAMGLR